MSFDKVREVAVIDQKKHRVLIFIVAYNAERTIESVLARIPVSLADEYEVEILAIDDSSRDRTFEVGHKIQVAGSSPFPLRVLFNPVNQGYGGNQKIGYHYAIQNNFDFVALLHGDGQYAPEVLPELLKPLDQRIADAVFGSRSQAMAPTYSCDPSNSVDVSWIANKSGENCEYFCKGFLNA